MVSLQCEFSCVPLSRVTWRRTLYNWSRSKASCHCASSYVSSCYLTERKPGHTGGRNMVSLQCEFSCDSLSVLTGRRTLYTRCRSKSSRDCVSFYASSGSQAQRKPDNTEDRSKVSLRCEFSCESSNLLTGWRTLCIWSGSKESRHGGFFGVSLGTWTGRNTCHKRCRERAVLQYGLSGVTLNLKSEKTTSDIFCNQKVSLLNESGCGSLVHCSKGRSCHTLGRGGPWSSAGWKLLVVINKNKKIDTTKRQRLSL